MYWSLCVLYVRFFFFFKQKTAYEMRISDWSSDVCSSDLIDLALKQRLVRAAEHGLEQLHARVRPLFGETLEALQQQPGRQHDLGGELDLGFPPGGETAGTTLPCRRFRQPGLRALVQDRKSGVEGKRVYGRVDLGGRRKLKK